MSILKALGTVLHLANSFMCDDNGNPYRNDDGGYLPNNEYDLDGTHYETDDRGSIYRADGKYYPDDDFVLDGERYFTDENGEVKEQSTK